ncbi:hypothetical protein PTKIN_Ptkin01aG0283500 [Pterospermum kingtungense]
MVMDKEGKEGDMERKAMEIAKKIIRTTKEEKGEEKKKKKKKRSSIKALDDFVEAIIAKRKELSATGSVSNGN